ncbi:type II secretion system F family protein [Kribbella sp. NPDC006257]|uniref:type II secretion system F family protein n=1 Tax=Kribbella sp. NPDC006257 TaxID=3156738 RepID=UPI0033A01F66
MLTPVFFAGLTVALLMPSKPASRRLNRRSRLTQRFNCPASPPIHRWSAAVAALAALLLFGFPLGLVIAPAIAVGLPLALNRLEPAAVRRRRARIAADLPLTVDLLAACLRAGRPPQAAVATVATATAVGPLADLLAGVGHRLALGIDPIDAWSDLLKEPACAPLARAVRRALRSGAPLARSLEHLADDARQARRWTVEEHARAVESRAVVPLGLCFLPAFVLLGVLPTVAGSLHGILHLFS